MFSKNDTLISRFPFRSASSPPSAPRNPAQVLSKTVSAVSRAIKKLRLRRKHQGDLLEDFEVLEFAKEEGDALSALPTYESIVFASAPSDSTLFHWAHEPTSVIAAPVPDAVAVADTIPAPAGVDEVLPAYQYTTSALPFAFTRNQVIAVAITPSLIFSVNEILKEKRRLSFGTIDDETDGVADIPAIGLASPLPTVESGLGDTEMVPREVFEQKLADLARELEDMCKVSLSLASVSDALGDIYVSEKTTDSTYCPMCQCRSPSLPAKVYASVSIQMDDPVELTLSIDESTSTSEADEDPCFPPPPVAPTPPPVYQAPTPISIFIQKRKDGKVMEKIRRESTLGDVFGELQTQFKDGVLMSGRLRKVGQRGPQTEAKGAYNPRAGLKKTGAAHAHPAASGDAKASELARVFSKRAMGAKMGVDIRANDEHDQDQDLVSELKLALDKRRSRSQSPSADDSSSSVGSSSPASSMFSSPRTSVGTSSPASDVESPWGSRLRGRAPLVDSPAPQSKRISGVKMELQALRSGRHIKEDGLSLTALAIVDRVRREMKERDETKGEGAVDGVGLGFL